MTDLLAKRPPRAFFTLSTDAWTKPFWDAAAEHRLVAPRCVDCGHFRLPPTPFCPQCRSQKIDWVTLSGRGTVYSYTVVARAVLPDMEANLPYVPAIVELEGAGGARLISNVVDVPVEAVRVGSAVRVVWDDEGGPTVPRFTLAD